jgi:nucleotide-binding universal stress UspA family protein
MELDADQYDSPPPVMELPAERIPVDYKTIVVHLDSDRACAERVDVAARLARGFAAHLVGVYVAQPGDLPFAPGAAPAAEWIARWYAEQRERSQEATGIFRARTARAGVDGAEARTAQGNAADMLALHARYADLLVLGQADPGSAGDVTLVRPDLPDHVVLACPRPVLVVPYAGTYPRLGEHILVAWDASAQAARSVTAALPLLTRAKRITVLVVNPGESGRHGEVPGADICLYLARHGVKAEAGQDHVKEMDVASWLVSRAFDLGADLIVMGAYGHSLARERLFGGVTRSLLGQMTVPVLMEH